MSCILSTAMAVLIKQLSSHLGVFQIAFFRTLASMVITIPLLVRAGSQSFITKQPVLQLFRAIAAISAIVCSFYAFSNLPLADATSLSFSRSLFLIPLALIFLSESVGWRRGGATIIGFIGVIVALRPTGAVDLPALVAVGGALLVAAATIMIKFLLRTDSLPTLLFYSGTAGTIALAIPTFYSWVTPTYWEWGLLALMSLCGVAAQGTYIRAFEVGEITALAPIDYTRLLFGTIAGLIVFSEIPDEWMIAGAAIIVSSTLYITRRESRIGKIHPPSPPTTAQDTPFAKSAILPTGSPLPKDQPNETKP